MEAPPMLLALGRPMSKSSLGSVTQPVAKPRQTTRASAQKELRIDDLVVSLRLTIRQASAGRVGYDGGKAEIEERTGILAIR
jgi:hypothetical protein